MACVVRAALLAAPDLNFTDHEDAVLHEAARADQVAAVVTRSGKAFEGATVPVFDPDELLGAPIAPSEA